MRRCDVGNAYFAYRITELDVKTNRLVKSHFEVFRVPCRSQLGFVFE